MRSSTLAFGGRRVIEQEIEFGHRPRSESSNLWAEVLGRMRGNVLAVIAAVTLALLVAVSFLGAAAPFVSRYEPGEQDLENLQSGPSADHFLGTDQLGRDQWARTLDGIRISLTVGVTVEVLVLLIALAIGSAAALCGRFIDGMLMRFTDVMYAFPDLLGVIVLRSVLESREWPIIGDGDPQIPGLPGDLLQVILAIAFVAWVTLARLIRSQVLLLAQEEYVLAARAMGASTSRVLLLHILPNALGPIIVAVMFGIPAAIFAEAVLGFIGFGLPPPSASLGTLVADGYTYFRVNAWMAITPAVAMALLMLCFSLLGDGLRDALDPRARRR